MCLFVDEQVSGYGGGMSLLSSNKHYVTLLLPPHSTQNFEVSFVQYHQMQPTYICTYKYTTLAHTTIYKRTFQAYDAEFQKSRKKKYKEKVLI